MRGAPRSGLPTWSRGANLAAVAAAERAQRWGSGRVRARTLVAAFGIGCAGGLLLTPLLAGPGPAGAAAPQSVTVKILPSGISPAVVNVTPGETVVWVNRSGATRSILASDASFDSGTLANGERFQFAFNQPRTVSYSVVQAPGVSGTVVVAAAGSSAPASVPATTPFAPAVPAANPADPQPAGFAYTGSATAINGLVGGLAVAFGAGLVMTARRYGVAATLSRLTFSLGPDDLLPSRRHRRERRDAARR